MAKPFAAERVAVVAAKPSSKAEAWILFDRIVDQAAPGGVHSNPWMVGPEGGLAFEPDYATLAKLLGVPLQLRAQTQSGVPALALDVWLSYELRRAGFERDQVWPRPVNPRVLPAAAASLMAALPGPLRKQVTERVAKTTSMPGVTSSSAAILGKNYLKQVDVIMTDWATGPELLISTKRMDSSYGKNAPNRIEESYGDAKNLRLRHPIAALGFVFGLRSDILQKEPRTADWLMDLLGKLGREDDAYHATCLILMEYSDDLAPPDGPTEPQDPGILEPGPEREDAVDEVIAVALDDATDRLIETLPQVTIRIDRIPDDLSPGRFLAKMVTHVLSATPVNMHEQARLRRASAKLSRVGGRNDL